MKKFLRKNCPQELRKFSPWPPRPQKKKPGSSHPFLL